MKKVLPLVLITFLILNLFCSGQESQYPGGSKPASTNVQNAQYPRMTSDHKASFRINAPV
jgi:hypothetical protein